MEQKVHTLKSGGRLHYLDAGSGDVLLFVHGIWANHHLWKGVIDALPGGFRGIAPDWPLGSQPEAFPRAADLSPLGANVFLPLDAPARVAEEIAAFVRGRD